MKACVLHNINDLRCEEVQMPTPVEDEVLLRIHASGICGSDIQRVFEKGTYHFPTIPGHEFAGEITAVGSKSDEALLGQKAAVFPLLPCFSCPACQIGEYAQCQNYDYYGSRRDGGFAEYLCVNKWNLVMVPEQVSFEEAAMCEPAAVALHALSRAEINLGDTVTIFGAGAIGIILAKIARLRGAGQVILADIDQTKLDFAQKLECGVCINNAKEDIASIIMKLTGNKGSNVTVEGTGSGAALASCLAVTAAFGHVVLMGNPLGDMNIPQKAYWEILRKQLTLSGTWNSSYNGFQNDWQKAIAAMPSLRLSELITHRYRLDQCNEAFAMLKKREEFAVKVMFINK